MLDGIVTEAQGTLTCGGDFNIALNPNLDSSGKRVFQSQKITKKINFIHLEFNDNGEVSPPVLWDTCKAVMRGKVIALTYFLKQWLEKLNTLQVELKKLESEHKNTLDSKVEIEMKMKRNIHPRNRK